MTSEVESRTVSVDGRRIAYRMTGSGPPVVLLHGAWSDSRSWAPQLEQLADEFTVVAWDAPGCGDSWDPPEEFTLADYADVVAGLVQELSLAPVHLVGLSFGGGLAIEVHRRHRDVVRSLVLAGAYAGWAGSLPAEEVRHRLTRVLAEAHRPPREWASDYLPGFFGGEVPAETLDAVIRIMYDVRPAGTVPMARAFAEADLRDALGGIDVATLLVHGELDARAPWPVVEALHRAIPDSELVVLPGVGHTSNLEAPQAFDDAVRRFLRSVPA